MLDIGRGVYNDNMKYYLAVDIGASSGRHIVGYRDADGKIQLDEVYRFPNGMKQSDDGLVWDVETLFAEVKNGLRAAIAGYGEICSMAIDTWGVDYVLMRGKQSVLPCFAYRNERTADDIDEVHKLVPFALISAYDKVVSSMSSASLTVISPFSICEMKRCLFSRI